MVVVPCHHVGRENCGYSKTANTSHLSLISLISWLGRGCLYLVFLVGLLSICPELEHTGVSPWTVQVQARHSSPSLRGSQASHCASLLAAAPEHPWCWAGCFPRWNVCIDLAADGGSFMVCHWRARSHALAHCCSPGRLHSRQRLFLPVRFLGCSLPQPNSAQHSKRNTKSRLSISFLKAHFSCNAFRRAENYICHLNSFILLMSLKR